MFSQTSEYALRVMVFLAGLGGTPATIRQIAAATHTPEGYLAKVLLSLSRAGLIRSQRGLHGGSVLLRSPEQITIYDVMEAVDPIQRITVCPLGLPSHGTNLCPLHKRLDDAIASVESALRASTIAELLAEPATSTPLVDDPMKRAAATAFATHAPDRLAPSSARRDQPPTPPPRAAAPAALTVKGRRPRSKPARPGRKT